ncbi:MAG TPA: hypothetical protein VIK61_11090 [Acidimicrobiia bacterium]
MHDASDWLIKQPRNHARENGAQAENGLARNVNESTQDLTTGALADLELHLESVLDALRGERSDPVERRHPDTSAIAETLVGHVPSLPDPRALRGRSDRQLWAAAS